MTLHIGITMPSRDLERSPIDAAVTQLAERVAVAKRAGRIPDGVTLDLTFMLSGRRETPPFCGLQMGGYTREDQRLHFHAAVPDRINRSEHAPRYVTAVLHDVVENAHDFFREHGVHFDTPGWRDCLETLTSEVDPIGEPHVPPPTRPGVIP